MLSLYWTRSNNTIRRLFNHIHALVGHSSMYKTVCNPTRRVWVLVNIHFRIFYLFIKEWKGLVRSINRVRFNYISSLLGCVQTNRVGGWVVRELDYGAMGPGIGSSTQPKIATWGIRHSSVSKAGDGICVQWLELLSRMCHDLLETHDNQWQP